MILRKCDYIAVAEFVCRYRLYFFMATCVWVGFVIVGPVFSGFARTIVFSTPFLRPVHFFFFGTGFWVIFPLFVYSLMLYVAFRFKPKEFPGGWNYEAEGAMPKPCEVVERRLLPSSLTEEYVFITWLIGVLFMIFWIPQIVGGLVSFSVITWIK
ncbi:MAG TPA: hypothetical protein ENO19_07860 [Halothiobacillaceae bacterium]|nr:hypothetical protein [Halothiobacillaceae bacterium]